MSRTKKGLLLTEEARLSPLDLGGFCFSDPQQDLLKNEEFIDLCASLYIEYDASYRKLIPFGEYVEVRAAFYGERLKHIVGKLRMQWNSTRL